MSTKIRCDIFLSSQDNEALQFLIKKKEINLSEAFKRAMRLYLLVTEAQEKKFTLHLQNESNNFKTQIVGF